MDPGPSPKGTRKGLSRVWERATGDVAPNWQPTWTVGEERVIPEKSECQPDRQQALGPRVIYYLEKAEAPP